MNNAGTEPTLAQLKRAIDAAGARVGNLALSTFG